MSDKTPDENGTSQSDKADEVRDMETPVATESAIEKTAQLKQGKEQAKKTATNKNSPPVKSKPRAEASGGSRAGRLLLVLVLVAGLAVLGWLYQEQRMLVAELRQQHSQQQSQLLDQQAALAALQDTFAAEFSAVQQSNEAYESQLDQQRQALQSLNQEVVSLRLGISSGQAGRDQSWLLNEAASALRMGQQYLNLARDTRTAISLYQSADELLREINDPAITALRGLLASDISLLQAVELLDIEGLYQQLSALTERAGELPLAVADQPQQFVPEAAVTETEAGFLAILRAELNQYFTVRRMDEPAIPLLRPEDMLLIRQNLQLQLEQAKLALLREQQEIWEQSLANAQNLLAHYAAGDRQGQQILESIEALQVLNVRTQVPMLSNSLTVLRDLLAAGERRQ